MVKQESRLAEQCFLGATQSGNLVRPLDVLFLCLPNSAARVPVWQQHMRPGRKSRVIKWVANEL